jgi:Ni/Fe-hydrogenase subunit HybB-like protein
VRAMTNYPRPTKPPPWHYLIVSDLFLSELSCGIFIVAALGDLIAPHVYGGAARIGYLLALPTILGDLICLVLDLGDPIRFHHMLRVINLKSPMSTGMWVLGAYALFSFICFILAAINLPSIHELRAIVAGFGLAPACFVGGYKGVMLSATAQPVWKDSRWLGAELVSSAGLLGIASLLLIALLLPARSAVSGLRMAQLILLFLNLALSMTFLIHIVQGFSGRGKDGETTLLLIMLTLFWVTPIVLTFLGGSWLLGTSTCLIILGAAALRHRLVMLPHKFS